MNRRLWIVDAFTHTPCSGNSAGVVLDADGLTDEQMQAIAREVNASETAFVSRPTTREAAAAVRWFTPTTEVPFCGHATLAAAHAMLESNRFVGTADAPAVVLPLETRFRGIVTVRTRTASETATRRLIGFDAPDLTIRPVDEPLERVLELLRLDSDALDPDLPPIASADNDLLLAVRDEAALMALRPLMSELTEYGAARGQRGVFVTTRRPSRTDVVACSRFFAPAAGVPEDPVTGSTHGPLALHLVRSGVVDLRDGRATFRCAQRTASGRGGVVHCDFVQRSGEASSMHVAGEAVTTIRGELACEL